jgi:helicase MOV-10
LVGDFVKVWIAGNEKEEFHGYASEVALEEVYLKFHDKFNRAYIKNQLCTVQFTVNRVPMRRMHQAIGIFLDILILTPTR